jgi:hypothetical protein
MDYLIHLDKRTRARMGELSTLLARRYPRLQVEAVHVPAEKRPARAAARRHRG